MLIFDVNRVLLLVEEPPRLETIRLRPPPASVRPRRRRHLKLERTMRVMQELVPLPLNASVLHLEQRRLRSSRVLQKLEMLLVEWKSTQPASSSRIPLRALWLLSLTRFACPVDLFALESVKVLA